jgi:PAS domain S-box-containing protein
MSLQDWLLNPSGLTPHGFCLAWAPGLVALHVASDAIIGLAYFSIPLAIAEFVRRRPDIRYGWVAYLFVAFILACGTTHFMSILTLWVPAYGVEGLIKLVTAALSIATAILLWPLIPQAAALPSAAQLEAVNADLEHRVGQRVTELEAVNRRLSQALEEKIQAEQALARSEAHFRADFEWAAVGKVHYDPVKGTIIRANRAHADWLGYEPEEMVGRYGWEFTYPPDRDGSNYQELAAGQVESYAREKRYLRRDGEPVWGRVSAAVVRETEGGEPLLAVAVVEDIDDRHKAQMALSKAMADLEVVVQERTAALAQRDLLLREVYHRVKNNLQVVDSLLLMQARRLADPEAKAALETLRGRVYALGLVHHQLMGSIDLETFEIAPFLEELSRHLLEAGGGTGISLTVRAAPLKVGLDFAIPLGLLVTELVTNSLKHAFGDGNGAIEVSLAAAESGWLELRVSDDGKGYDPAGATAQPSLGRAIIEGLVQQLRGAMTVATGGGVRTVVRLPAPAAA